MLLGGALLSSLRLSLSSSHSGSSMYVLIEEVIVEYMILCIALHCGKNTLFQVCAPSRESEVKKIVKCVV